MSEPFLGEIRIIGFNFPPSGWAECDGQLLPIAQNSALFSLFGTTYGGDGETTFSLPDLRGRFPMHKGNGPGLTSRIMGQRVGTEGHTLSTSHLASHTHTGHVVTATTEGDRTDPSGAYMARPEEPVQPYAGTSGGQMSSGSVAIGNTGSGSYVNHTSPGLAVNFVVALNGIYPSQN